MRNRREEVERSQQNKTLNPTEISRYTCNINNNGSLLLKAACESLMLPLTAWLFATAHLCDVNFPYGQKTEIVKYWLLVNSTDTHICKDITQACFSQAVWVRPCSDLEIPELGQCSTGPRSGSAGASWGLASLRACPPAHNNPPLFSPFSIALSGKGGNSGKANDCLN